MSSKVIISKSALVHNLRAYRRAVGDTQIMAVVKSNAYGHGIDLVSSAIERETDWFGVASGLEALSLRQTGIKKPILVLSFYDPFEIPDLIKRNVSLAVYDIKQARLISAAAKKLKKTARIHLKVDTGTSRLGILPADVAFFADKLLRLPNLKIEGVFSHFAASEENLEFTHKQNLGFNTVIEELEWRGIVPIKHIACTAAGIVSAAGRHDMVRLGIGLYGLWPSDFTRKKAKFAVRPVLSWQTQVIQVKALPKGAFVGYDLTYQTRRATKLAVLPIGYFDGFDRRFSNNGQVLINGKRCKILGRVCMNLTMVDVTDLKKVRAGDKVELIGAEISADELAKTIDTINYEVVARINPLIPRILK
ncbi:MAG: alanine racemase [Candidatus Doudnabacteria bacterium]